MTVQPTPLFSFDEKNHLTRIHLRLALEDLGFTVEEADNQLRLLGESGGAPGKKDTPPEAGQ